MESTRFKAVKAFRTHVYMYKRLVSRYKTGLRLDTYRIPYYQVVYKRPKGKAKPQG